MTASALKQDLDLKNKSWAELCEEDDSNETVKNTTVEDEDSKTIGDVQDVRVKLEGEAKNDDQINFRTYANLFKSNDNTPDDKSSTQSFPQPDSGTLVKKPTPVVQDDLSLSGHLDTFHMASPLKFKSNHDSMMMDDDTKVSPFKNKRRHTRGKGRGDESGESPSEVLRSTEKTRRHGESPSKVLRSADRNRRRQDQHTPYAKFKDGSRKRQRDDNIESPGTPSTPGSGKKLAMETDPGILLRRQKQIDFGKNTVGYDRYCSMVKREERTKDHPKTPPKDLKYSRRAWDGLIKSWRSRLHFWDPPNENGEPNGLELDEEDDDISSLDSQSVDSMPCTPIQEWKRRVRAKRDSFSEDDDEDCKPLQE